MKKMILLLGLLIVIAISGCATDHGSTGGGEEPESHQGHRH